MFYKVGRTFNVPSLDLIDDKAFEKAMVVVTKPKDSYHGRHSWMSGLLMEDIKDIYELIHEKKTLADIGKYILSKPYAIRKGKKVTYRTLIRSIGNFGSRLEDYFKDVELIEKDAEKSLEVIKSSMVTTEDDYKVIVDPKNFTPEYLKSATTLLRNAVKLEARIDWLISQETQGRVAKNKFGRSIVVETKDVTAAQKALHDIHREIMVLLKQNIKVEDDESGLSDEELSFLFKNKERTENLAKASTLLIKSLKKKSISLFKDDKGNYKHIGSKSDGQ